MVEFNPKKWVFAPKRKIKGVTFYQFAQACPKKTAMENKQMLAAHGHRVRLIRKYTQMFGEEYEVWATEK